jgi:hypothetical protein
MESFVSIATMKKRNDARSLIRRNPVKQTERSPLLGKFRGQTELTLSESRSALGVDVSLPWLRYATIKWGSSVCYKTLETSSFSTLFNIKV